MASNGDPLGLNSLQKPVGRFDLIDLAAGVGSLSLLRDNSRQFARLQVAAEVVSAFGGSRSTRMSQSKWNGFLNKGPLANPQLVLQEDPFEELFIEEVHFTAGPYLITSGHASGAIYVLNHLLKAIFLSDPFPSREYQRRASQAARAILTISDEIFLAAGYQRQTAPIDRPRQPVVFPQEGRFERLKQAVTFNAEEMAAILDPVPVNALEPFLRVQREHEALNDPLHGRWLTKPILHIDDQYVVLLPGGLATALRHYLICAAIDLGVQDELAIRFRDAVFDSMTRDLELLRLNRLALDPPTPTRSDVSSRYFELDSDKVLHVQLSTDHLGDYSNTDPFGDWPSDRFAEDTRDHLRAVDEHLFRRVPAPNDVLHLVVNLGVGRGRFVGWEGPVPPVEAPNLLLKSDDLHTIVINETPDQLAVWYFAKAVDDFHESVRVVSTGMLDEYALYKKYNKTFYMSDEARPTMAHVETGWGIDPVISAHETLDIHSVPYFELGNIVQVWLAHGDQSVPIYFPRMDEDRVVLLVEALPINIWVIAPRTLERDIRHPYVELVDAIAYWVWQLAKDLEAPLSPLFDEDTPLVIEIDLVDPAAWIDIHAPRGALVEPRLTIEENRQLKLKLDPSLVPTLSRPDNQGERLIVKELMRGLVNDLVGADLSPDQLNQIVDDVAPLGMKKKISMVTSSITPELAPGRLPDPRHVHEAAMGQTLDFLGRELRKGGYEVGPIPDDRRTHVLNAAVEIYFDRLTRIVQSLNPTSLLEWLVAQNEALIRQDAQRRLNLPTSIACFGNEPAIVDRLRKEIPESTNSQVSNRFLIELVAAHPPHGLRPMSLAVYDEMLALASEISSRGWMSDLVNYELSDHEVSILGSGRLGVSREGRFETGRASFLVIFAEAERGRAESMFSSFFESSSGSSQGPTPEIEDAVRDEFGFSLSAIVSGLLALLETADQRGSLEIRSYTDVQQTIANELSISHTETDAFIETFSLRARDDFLNPPPPFARSDVYPWRYGRDLSYVRRPLIIRTKQDGAQEVLFGFRHLYLAVRQFVTVTIMEGRLTPQSATMRSLRSKVLHQAGEEFNDRVADSVETHGHETRRRVRKMGTKRLIDDGRDLGDIDVLTAITELRQIWVIDTKHLAAARTPAEMKNEIAALFSTEGNHSSAAEKHLRRATWVQTHLSDVLSFLGIAASEDWTVEPSIVVDIETMSPFVRQSPIKVHTFRELLHTLEEVLAPGTR